MNSTYNINISYQTEETAWDAFVAQVPGGNHLQTSLWGQVKTFSGWRSARIIVTEREEIVAGAQLLIKSLPLTGSIAYIPKGPLFNRKEPVLRKLIITALFNLIKKHRIAYIIIQPPLEDKELSHQLLQKGFQPSDNNVAPIATVLLDLSMDLDDILSQMKSKTRYGIRIGQRKGVIVREGTENDLHIFHNLLVATSQRKKFSPEPEAYFLRMWRLLYPPGHAKLFLAEYKGEVSSAALVIPFGNTVIYKRGAWSGSQGKLRPNEVIQWGVIKWAKSHGYKFYDLEGIDADVARNLVSNNHSTDKTLTGTNFFKISFGGSVILFPSAYDYIPNPMFRYIYTRTFPKISKSSTLAPLYKYFCNLCIR